MLFSKLLLLITGIVFLGYGLLCAIAPAYPAEFIGYHLDFGGTTVEVVAMYGGLQIGLGITYIVAAAKSDFTVQGLKLLLIILGSVAIGRFFGLIVHGVDGYNIAALFYELTTIGLAISALVLERAKAQAPIAEQD